MKEQNKATRREFLKSATLGAGSLLVCGQTAVAQPGGGRGQTQTQPRSGQQRGPLPIKPENPSIQHHRNRCRNCGRCRIFCQNTTKVFGHAVPSGEDACIGCGQCTHYCTRAITEKYNYPAVAQAVADPNKIVVASTAPAIRVALGDMYRMAPGTNVEGKIVGALKQLGVDHVLDVTFSADLTIMEEASELLQRLDNKAENMPMFTSCCPAWTWFVHLFYPSLKPNLSTVKSPVTIQGALVKTYFAQKMGIAPETITHVALTPCTAKKREILFGMNAAGVSLGKPEMQDVDIALTCREISLLLNERRVDFLQAQDAPYGSLMGAGSGAGMIFGNTGGVMEAALRTAYKLLNGTNPPVEFLELRSVRGLDGVRRATVDLGNRKLNVAVVHGIGVVRPLIESIRNGTEQFDFVEAMACPGGCIGGGGQPIVASANVVRTRELRLNALYQRDAGQTVRLSCDNPQVKAVYDEFLGKPLGEKAKKLLHIERG